MPAVTLPSALQPSRPSPTDDPQEMEMIGSLPAALASPSASALSEERPTVSHFDVSTQTLMICQLFREQTYFFPVTFEITFKGHV